MNKPTQLCFGAAFVISLHFLAAATTNAQSESGSIPEFEETGTLENESAETSKKDAPEITGVSFSNSVKNRWRVGVKIKGGSRSARNFLVTIPVPVNWPEQVVELHSEDMPAEVRSV